MSESRTKNTKRNIVFSYLDSIITMLFQFVSRLIIVQVLGEQYLGLSSLFQSILQVLNMVELGFSSAIIFNMYKPLADGDTEAVCSLLNYYKKIYSLVSIVVLIVGLLVLPFLSQLINGESPEGINIYILYFLYLVNTCTSYMFFAHKTALLNALQRLDLSMKSYMIVNLMQYVFQILSLTLFKNYYLFVFWMITGTICKNVFSEYISKKMFPQYICKGEISPEIRKDVISRVRGLLVCNISGVTYTTFDSIILSSFVGLTAVAIYNNYLTVFAGVTTLITLIRNAMQASVGNSVATETKEKNYQDMLLWQFLFSFIATLCVTCMISLYQPFMELWMGKDLLLSFNNVILIALWFFVSVIQNSYFLYLSGNGLWWEMRWPYILSTLTNLGLNIMLGKIMGITGIILSTLISTVLYGLIWQCSIIFRIYFIKSTFQFYLRQMTYFLICCICSGVALLVNTFISITGIMGIILRLVICIIVASVLQVLFYHKMGVFINAKRFVNNVLKNL